MKKVLLMVFTALLVFSLASCGSRGTLPNTASSSAQSNGARQEVGTSSEQRTKTDSGQENLLSVNYVNIMKSGKFLIRCKTSVADGNEKADAEITTAIDGENSGTIIKTNGLSTHTIFKDNVLYMLDDANKTFTKMNVSQNEQSSKNGSLTDTEDLKYIGSGTGTVNGKSLPYEEYSAGNDTTLRFYMDGRNLYALASKSEGVQVEMIVLELNGNVPAGMISIPSDYKDSTAMAIPGGIDAIEEEQAAEDE